MEMLLQTSFQGNQDMQRTIQDLGLQFKQGKPFSKLWSTSLWIYIKVTKRSHENGELCLCIKWGGVWIDLAFPLCQAPDPGCNSRRTRVHENQYMQQTIQDVGLDVRQSKAFPKLLVTTGAYPGGCTPGGPSESNEAKQSISKVVSLNIIITFGWKLGKSQ